VAFTHAISEVGVLERDVHGCHGATVTLIDPRREAESDCRRAGLASAELLDHLVQLR
jgi:hypothetical protein